MEDGEVLNCLRLTKENGARLMDVPQRLNCTELSREEFQYNLLIWYDIVVLNLSTDCDGFGKKLLVTHAIS